MTSKNPQPLTDTQITDALQKLPNWQRDGDKIKKVYKFDDYLDGLVFASAVATIAQGLDHHPDILITYKKVTVTYYTHAAGDKITQDDVNAATTIEGLPFKPGV